MTDILQETHKSLVAFIVAKVMYERHFLSWGEYSKLVDEEVDKMLKIIKEALGEKADIDRPHGE